MAFDELGRLWVVEMLDDPLGPKPGEPPLGRIKILTDVDGDGRFEDEWFRPVFLAGGPDDAICVVDSGRAVIEHPAWMPPSSATGRT